MAVESQDPAHMQLLNSALHSRIFEPATPKGPSRRRSHDNESEGSRLHDMDPIQDPVTTLTHSAVTLSTPSFITYQRTSTHTSFLYLSPHTTYQATFDFVSHRKIAAARGSTNTPAEWSLVQSIWIFCLRNRPLCPLHWVPRKRGLNPRSTNLHEEGQQATAWPT